MLANSPRLSRWLRRPPLVSLVIALATFAVAAGLRFFGALQAMELAAYDTYLRLRPEPAWQDPRVTLVRVTDEDIHRLGQWPLPDETLADVLEALLQDGPRAVGLDLYRDLPVPPGSTRLEALLRAFPRVVAIEKFRAVDGSAVPAPAALAGTERVGFSDVVLDPGGAVRRALLFLDDGERVAYSLALRLALLYLAGEGVAPQPGDPDPSHLRLGRTTLAPLEPSDGGYAGVDAAGYQFLLDFRGGARPFLAYTLADLLGGQMPASARRDRVVLLGVDADSVKDHFLSPYSRGGDSAASLPGMYLHAHALGQLLRMALDGDRPVRFLPEPLEYAWVLAWSLLGAGLALLVRSIGRFAVLAPPAWLALVALTYGAFLGGWWLPAVPAAMAMFASATLVVAYLSGFERSERRFLMDLFSRHVSQDVADTLWREREKFITGGRIEAQTLTVTVLFTDLENFTPVAERLTPESLMDWLNEYMERMAGLVMAHGGVVDDYYGDAIKANFGAPVARTTPSEIDRDARNAVECALAMTREMGRMNEVWSRQGLPRVRMRVGICTGPVVAGCIGSARRMKYTTIGDVVNTAARLESYGKEIADEDRSCPCRVMLAESTVRRLGGQLPVRPVGALQLKGKHESINVFQLLTGGPSEPAGEPCAVNISPIPAGSGHRLAPGH
jgi:adenylate cyclase